MNIGTYESFVDHVPVKFVTRRPDKGCVKNLRRLSDATQQFVEPSLLVSSRPTIDIQRPFQDTEHFIVGLLTEIRPEVVRFNATVIDRKVYFIQ